ncbi:MAG: phosphatase PAP2 family protein [Anaerolineales bacterium]
MPNWIEIGLDWVLAVQAWGPWLVGPMEWISELGTEPFYLLVMPIVLWCYDYALGFRLGLILIASALTNGWLKLAFALPRPFWVSSGVETHSFETSFGLPSGHAQNGVTVWGRLAHGLRTRWAYAGAIILILLISISRLYLGMHFPQDAIGGLIAGALLLLVFLWLEEPVWRWFKHQRPLLQVLSILGVSFGSLLISLLIWQSSLGQALPADWMALAAEAAPEGAMADPRMFDGFVSLAGLLLGFPLGAWQLHRSGGIHAKGALILRTARFAVGVAGVSLLFFGLDLLGPSEGSAFAYLWRYARYAVVGYWITFVAPRLFRRMGLAMEASPTS